LEKSYARVVNVNWSKTTRDNLQLGMKAEKESFVWQSQDSDQGIDILNTLGLTQVGISSREDIYNNLRNIPFEVFYKDDGIVGIQSRPKLTALVKDHLYGK